VACWQINVGVQPVNAVSVDLRVVRCGEVEYLVDQDPNDYYWEHHEKGYIDKFKIVNHLH